MFGIDDALGAVAIGAAGGIVSGLIGFFGGNADREQRDAQAKAAFEKLKDIGLPPDMASQLILKQFQVAGELDPATMKKFESAGMMVPKDYQALAHQPSELQKKTSVGTLSPQLEQAIAAGPSKVAQITEQPGSRQAQLNALAAMSERAQTGFGAQERAALDTIRNQVAGDTQSRLAGIRANMQQRGMGGAGSELAQQLQAAQSGANTAAMQGEQLSANAAQNALAAIQAQSGMAGQLRGQDWTAAQTKAQAEDAINQFNTQNAISRQARNISNQNQAQAENLTNAQNIANDNSDMANKVLLSNWNNQQDIANRNISQANAAQQYNLTNAQNLINSNTNKYYDLAQGKQNIANQNIGMYNADKARQLQGQLTNWNNQKDLITGQSNALMGQSNLSGQRAAETGQMWGGIGQGLVQGGQAYANYLAKQPQTPTVALPSVETSATPSLTGPNFLNINPAYGGMPTSRTAFKFKALDNTPDPTIY